MILAHFRRQQGFTLVEILVVCAIVAIILGAAMMKLELSDSQRLAATAETLVRRLEAARDDAVMRGQSLAFSSDGQGYQFWLSDTERNVWVALPDNDVITSGRFPQGISLSAIRVNGLPRPLGERLTFYFSGLADAFALTLSAGTSAVDVDTDVLGRIEIRHAP